MWGGAVNEWALSFFTLYTSVLFEYVQQARTGISPAAMFYHAKLHSAANILDSLLDAEQCAPH